jgi:hypothetical protein
MSQENVEIVRQVVEIGNRRGTEAALPYVDPEGELQSAIIGGAEGNICRGREGLREWMAESDATFEELRVEPEEFRDLGDDVLLIPSSVRSPATTTRSGPASFTRQSLPVRDRLDTGLRRRGHPTAGRSA